MRESERQDCKHFFTPKRSFLINALLSGYYEVLPVTRNVLTHRACVIFHETLPKGSAKMLHVSMTKPDAFALTIFTSLVLMLTAGVHSVNAAGAHSHGVRNIVLVHGAWADGSSWAKVIPLLQAKGYRVTAVQNPLTSLSDDVAATKRALDLQDGPALLVGHSWAGMVITQAGTASKVAGLVYINAFAPSVGDSATSLGRGYPTPPGVKDIRQSDGFLWLTPSTVAQYFTPELSPSESAVVAATQVPITGASFTETVTVAAWKTKPSWCIVGMHDQMIDPDLERAMAKKIKAKVLELDAGHTSMLEQPEKVANFIASAAASL